MNQTIAYRILEMLQEKAPNGKAQEICVDVYRNIQTSVGFDKDEADRQMVGILYDGLAYGNWPWIVFTKSE